MSTGRFAPLNPVDTVYIYIDEEKDYEDVILQLKEMMRYPPRKSSVCWQKR